MTKQTPKIKIDDVIFYFDAVVRDQLDSAGYCRKSGEILALRSELLKLSDGEFSAAVKTVKQLVADKRKPAQENPSRDSKTLLYNEYQRAKDPVATGAGASKASSVQAARL